MIYRSGNYVSVRQGNSILEGTLYSSESVSLAEDEEGSIMGMTGPEYVEIESQGERIRVRGSDILSPVEVLRMRRKQQT